MPTRRTRCSFRRDVYKRQDTQLFHDSIENNVKLAKLSATHEEVVQACKKAAVHDFIMTLPQGYATPRLLYTSNDQSVPLPYFIRKRRPGGRPPKIDINLCTDVKLSLTYLREFSKERKLAFKI